LWGLNKLKSGYFTRFLALYNTTQNLYIYRMLNKTNTKQGESIMRIPSNSTFTKELSKRFK